ncbi:hypothetical protein Poly30_25590 [Planctomycetes bacterium Poly30]|uniref:Uncharacterized protein n=1 Tax=Saltatorellus ferox TaxID=2528018 RepID=A0A518ESH1_9BACT|nr:hypothetical protein Poly30_25590 [Planctomycetes bacterium Poly30]
MRWALAAIRSAQSIRTQVANTQVASTQVASTQVTSTQVTSTQNGSDPVRPKANRVLSVAGDAHKCAPVGRTSYRRVPFVPSLII